MARRRRRGRRRQRQRDRQIDMNHRQHQRQRRNWTPRTQLRMDYTSGQSIQRRLQENSWNPLCATDPTEEQMDSPYDEIVLDAYELERMDPRDTREQERLEQTREEERSEQQLLQFELCDHIDHFPLQRNHPLLYD